MNTRNILECGDRNHRFGMAWNAGVGDGASALDLSMGGDWLSGMFNREFCEFCELGAGTADYAE